MTDTFDGFKTKAEIASYIYAEHGVEALRVLLDMELNPAKHDVLDDDGKVLKPSTAESLMDTADEFQELGLNEAAEVVLEAAKGAKPANETCLNEGSYTYGEKVFPYRNCKCSKCRPPQE